MKFLKAVFDFRGLTASMMARTVPPAIPHSFAGFGIKFQNSDKILYFGRSRKMTYEKAQNKNRVTL